MKKKSKQIGRWRLDFGRDGKVESDGGSSEKTSQVCDFRPTLEASATAQLSSVLPEEIKYF